jgi:DNA (cytosine-5)-methyltransferase 1
MIKSIDLFSGAGGLTLGLKKAGVKTICAVEINRYAIETFASHTPEADLHCSDIQYIDLANYRGKIDLVYGGPPCQPFSSGGLRNSEKDKRDFIPWFVKAIEIIKPSVFLMENVPGLAVGKRGAYLATMISALENLGFYVSVKVINAADFGIPQIRRRLFLVGMRDWPFLFPSETHGPNREFPHITVDDVLPPYQLGEPNNSKVFYAKNPDLRPSPFHGKLFNGGGRPINRTRPAPTILASAGGNKTLFFDDLNLVPAYHKHLVERGEPRTGELPGARRLTITESAILQTFPADMKFSGPRSAQYRLIGDAVPPLLATVLGKSIVRQLQGEKDESIKIRGSQYHIFSARRRAS